MEHLNGELESWDLFGRMFLALGMGNPSHMPATSVAIHHGLRSTSPPLPSMDSLGAKPNVNADLAQALRIYLARTICTSSVARGVRGKPILKSLKHRPGKLSLVESLNSITAGEPSKTSN